MLKHVGENKLALLEELEELVQPLTESAWNALAKMSDLDLLAIIRWIQTKPERDEE